MPPSRALRHLLVPVTAAALAAPLHAQDCRVASSRTSMAEFAGARIRSLSIETEAPPHVPGVGVVLDHLHVTTRESTIRRQLTFAEGDVLDTMAVAESMRRLRRLRYLGEAELQARRCAGADGVALTLRTRDLFSARASVRMGSGSTSALELTERNVLGTGREASVAVRTDGQRVGIGGAIADPFLLGARLQASVGTSGYRDGGEWWGGVGTRERTVLDAWRARLDLGRSWRRASDAGDDEFRRERASLLVTRRLWASAGGVTGLVAGAEWERASLAAGEGAAIVGPSAVRRSVVTLDAGLARRALRYDTLAWLLPSRAIVDVPLALEGELVAGVGRDLERGAPALRLDGWMGRAWIPARGALVVADMWGSGLQSAGRWSAGTARASVSGWREASGGLWAARVAAEKLFGPDPDVRALAIADPTLRALPERARLAEVAVGASLERSWRLRGLTRSWALDGAAFGAASLREDPAAGGRELTHAEVLGVGLRLAPTKMGRGTARLDIGFPVSRSPDVPARPYIAISLSPWLGAPRHRDGAREP
jgi:hypothetical protein